MARPTVCPVCQSTKIVHPVDPLDTYRCLKCKAQWSMSPPPDLPTPSAVVDERGRAPLAECSIVPNDRHAPDLTARATADVEKVRRAGRDVRVAVATGRAWWNLEARL